MKKIFLSASVLLALCASSKALSSDYFTATYSIYAYQNISAGISMSAPYVTGNSYLYTPGYVQVNGPSYFGSYGGDFALRVSNTDGSVVMKKAQGDILMGQFGN